MFFRKQQTRTEKLQIDGLEIEVSYKRIKNLYLKVSHHTGKIRVSAPVHAPEPVVRNFVLSRKGWIGKQLSKKVKRAPVRKLQFRDGELHSVDGKEYPLKVIEATARPKVSLEEEQLVLRVRPGSDRSQREKVLDDWYRARLKKAIPMLIKKWEPVMEVKVSEFGVRKMKTRWGTCNTRVGRIWLSLELAKKDPEALEYVVVHEMVHLHERLHNKRFYELMTRFLPDWKERQEALNGRIC